MSIYSTSGSYFSKNYFLWKDDYLIVLDSLITRGTTSAAVITRKCMETVGNYTQWNYLQFLFLWSNKWHSTMFY